MLLFLKILLKKKICVIAYSHKANADILLFVKIRVSGLHSDRKGDLKNPKVETKTEVSPENS